MSLHEKFKIVTSNANFYAWHERLPSQLDSLDVNSSCSIYNNQLSSFIYSSTNKMMTHSRILILDLEIHKIFFYISLALVTLPHIAPWNMIRSSIKASTLQSSPIANFIPSNCAPFAIDGFSTWIIPYYATQHTKKGCDNKK